MQIKCSNNNDKLRIEYIINDIAYKNIIKWNFLNFNELTNRHGNELLIDLLYISVFIYAVDRAISRESFRDSFTRELSLIVPVWEVDLWRNHKESLTNILGFLSGDIWHFDFVKRNNAVIEDTTVEVRDSGGYISLLSGGLDSFIGAIDLLEQGIKDTVFLSWYGGGKNIHPSQKAVRQALKINYGLEDNSFGEFYLSVSSPKEDTMRTRSFLILSHAVAMCFEKRNVKNTILIPENGFISINIPLTDARMGSSTTRTTHPYFIMLFNELIKSLGFNIRAENPYRFKTKGQMINECLNQRLLTQNLNRTISCAHPDSKDGLSINHCGYCWPCIIRRSAMNASGINDPTEYRISMKKESSIKFLMKPYEMFIMESKKMPAELLLLKSGYIINDFDKYVEVINKGIYEIKEFLSFK